MDHLCSPREDFAHGANIGSYVHDDAFFAQSKPIDRLFITLPVRIVAELDQRKTAGLADVAGQSPVARFSGVFAQGRTSRAERTRQPEVAEAT